METTEMTLAKIEEKGFVYSGTSSNESDPIWKGMTRTWTPFQTLENNVCRTMKGDDKLLCGGAYKFPLVGGANESDISPIPATLTSYIKMTCEVTGQEKVTVVAGAFDTIKIECNGRWINAANTNVSGRAKNIVRYAPTVNNMVKRQFSLYYPNGNLNVNLGTELTAYSPK